MEEVIIYTLSINKSWRFTAERGRGARVVLLSLSPYRILERVQFEDAISFLCKSRFSIAENGKMNRVEKC